MDIFLIVFILLVTIAASNVVNRIFAFIPVPLIQIALGIGLALLPGGIKLELEPELFFVLFVAPLLFNDGKSVPRDELWRLRAPILFLAFGLVFATVLIGGYAIHWAIPVIPLPAAFALAAILSPTDAVSVGAMSKRIKLPKPILRLLEGEALMNDASGLVAFKFAIAATVTGAFSIGNAVGSFFVIAVGGLLCGAVLAFLIVGLRMMLRRYGLEDVTVHMLIYILTPFFIYLAAEHLHLSGILAVVAGGIVHAVERDRTEGTTGKLQVVSTSTWSVIVYVLNGLVFVLLGLQIPETTGSIIRNDAFDNYHLAGYLLLITAILILLRFLWVYLFWSVSRRKTTRKRQLHASLLTALSGVRGAITLAGALSIPHVLQDGSAFPARELMIFLAAGVILVSLLIASIVLPLLLDSEPAGGKEGGAPLLEYKIRMLEAAVRSIREEADDGRDDGASAVIADYLQLIQQVRTEGSRAQLGSDFQKEMTRLQLKGIRAEREKLLALFTDGQIDARVTGHLQVRLSQAEQALSNRWWFAWRMFGWLLRRLVTQRQSPLLTDRDAERMRFAKAESARAAIAAIEQLRNKDNEEAIHAAIGYYRELLERLNGGMRRPKKRQEERVRVLQGVATQAERNEILRLLQDGEITRRMANELRSFVNYREVSKFR